MRIDGHKYELSSLKALLGNDDSPCYCIPNYQRIGVWGEDNIKRLLTDVVDGICSDYESLSQRKARNDMFIGTMVFLKDDSVSATLPDDAGGISVPVRKVVDGQQRLAAMIMACLVLHEDMAALQEKIAKKCGDASKLFRRVEELMEELLSVAAVDMTMPRLVALLQDNWPSRQLPGKYHSPLAHYVANYLSGSPSEKLDSAYPQGLGIEHEIFSNALGVMRSTVGRICDGKPVDVYLLPDVTEACSDKVFVRHFLKLTGTKFTELHTGASSMRYLYRAMMLARYLLSHVRILWLQVTNEDDALDIFESLNATGVQLTSIETFKPVVVFDLGQAQFEATDAADQFASIEQCLGAVEDQRSKHSTLTVSSMSLAESGTSLRNTHLRTQRTYLRSAYADCRQSDEKNNMEAPENILDRQTFVRLLRCNAELVSSIVRKKEQKDSLIGEVDLEMLGNGKTAVSPGAGYSLAFLQDLNHSSSVPMLARLYHQHIYLSGKKRERAIETARSEMSDAVKSVAAFYALMRLVGNPANKVDDAHKKIMDKLARTQYPDAVNADLVRQALADKLTEAIRSKIRANNEQNEDDFGAGLAVRSQFVSTCSATLLRAAQALAKFLLLLYSNRDNVAIPRSAWYDEWAKKAVAVVPESKAAGKSGWTGNMMLLPSQMSKEVGELHKVSTDFKGILVCYAGIIHDGDYVSETKTAVREYLLSTPLITSKLLKGPHEDLLKLIRAQQVGDARLQPNDGIIDLRGHKLAEFAWDTLAVEWLGVKDDSG